MPSFQGTGDRDFHRWGRGSCPLCRIHEARKADCPRTGNGEFSHVKTGVKPGMTLFDADASTGKLTNSSRLKLQLVIRPAIVTWELQGKSIDARRERGCSRAVGMC